MDTVWTNHFLIEATARFCLSAGCAEAGKSSCLHNKLPHSLELVEFPGARYHLDIIQGWCAVNDFDQ